MIHKILKATFISITLLPALCMADFKQYKIGAGINIGTSHICPNKYNINRKEIEAIEANDDDGKKAIGDVVENVVNCNHLCPINAGITLELLTIINNIVIGPVLDLNYKYFMSQGHGFNEKIGAKLGFNSGSTSFGLKGDWNWSQIKIFNQENYTSITGPSASLFVQKFIDGTSISIEGNLGLIFHLEEKKYKVAFFEPHFRLGFKFHI